MPHSHHAIIDLGSNSFHLMIAEDQGPSLRVTTNTKHMVRLREGLRQDGTLHPAVQARAMLCIEAFAATLRQVPGCKTWVIGTDTLRKAAAARQFVAAIEHRLGTSVEIISGAREAQLIYAGAISHVRAAHPRGNDRDSGPFCVIDIGGGSTEIATGADAVPAAANSLGLGCISLTRQFFSPDRHGSSFAERFRLATNHAGQLIDSVVSGHPLLDRCRFIGCSGTIKTALMICDLLQLRGITTVEAAAQSSIAHNTIAHNTILALVAAAHDHATTTMHLPVEIVEHIGEARYRNLPGGLAILMALYRKLGIERLSVSPTALREGALLEMVAPRNPSIISAVS